MISTSGHSKERPKQIPLRKQRDESGKELPDDYYLGNEEPGWKYSPHNTEGSTFGIVVFICCIIAVLTAGMRYFNGQ